MRVERERPAGLTDWAYGVIKDSILSLELPMGAQVSIDRLCEDLEVSRTPIREALLQLQGDGLVETVPRVGFFVTEITRSDLEELFELRALLESYAAKRAALLLTDAELTHIDGLLSASRRAVGAMNMTKFLEHEVALHAMIAEGAHNGHLLKMMESLADLTYRERALSVHVPRNVQASCVEHSRIVDAVCARDPEQAGSRMWEHIWAVRERILEFFDTLAVSGEGIG